jgi:hypothetical protein
MSIHRKVAGPAGKLWIILNNTRKRFDGINQEKIMMDYCC